MSKGAGEVRTLLEMLQSRKVDWRFPNSLGLFDRNLDCRQLSVMEVLQWKEVPDIGSVFIDYFDCTISRTLLRRKEPEFQSGWGLLKQFLVSGDQVDVRIKQAFEENGYCLLFYRAYDMTFSAYYNKYDVIHWTLVIDCNEQYIVMLDSAAAPLYYRSPFNCVPWDVFMRDWNRSADGGLAIVHKTDESRIGSWDDTVCDLMNKSVHEMMHNDGLDSLKRFIEEIRDIPLPELTMMLDRLEFDIHYFRRLRELWRLLLENGSIPSSYIRPEWAEELVYLCKSWSYVLGVVMKWKKQRDRDYRGKVLDYLWQAYESEGRLVQYWEQFLRSSDREVSYGER